MNIEENRLRTFNNWPTNAAVSADRIAKAGFYYTGMGLEVQCFLCGTKITEWNYGDQAMARHRQASPDCPFVMNPSSTCNIPLLPPSVSDGDLSPSTLGHAQSVPAVPAAENQRLLSTAVRSQDPLKQYRTVRQRLKSFANWPIYNVISPERLAKAGFYYLQQADLVECVFCRGVILKWALDDDPEKEHRTHFPNCDFYLRKDNENDSDSSDDEVAELTNVKLMAGTKTGLKDLGIQTHTAPRRPKHATYAGRLQTFQDWPQELKQTPDMLATAGFYYVGVEDQVRCFHCDGGLRNWEATDDAWIEHAKWFPRCDFVNLVRGPEFIKQCVNKRPPLDPAITASVPEDNTGEISNTPPPPAPLPRTSPPSRNVTDAVLQELLQTPAATAALEIGLRVGEVKRAIKKRIQEVGRTYDDGAQLIIDVFVNEPLVGDARSESQNSDSSIDNSLDQVGPIGPVDISQNYVPSQVVTAQTQNTSASSVNDTENSNTCPVTNGGNKREEHENTTQRCEISDNEDKAVQKESADSAESVQSASLAEENKRLKEARLCKICMDREVAIVFLPCGHLATCVHCAPSLMYCPLCRQAIRATVRTFVS